MRAPALSKEQRLYFWPCEYRVDRSIVERLQNTKMYPTSPLTPRLHNVSDSIFAKSEFSEETCLHQESQLL